MWLDAMHRKYGETIPMCEYHARRTSLIMYLTLYQLRDEAIDSRWWRELSSEVMNPNTSVSLWVALNEANMNGYLRNDDEHFILFGDGSPVPTQVMDVKQVPYEG